MPRTACGGVKLGDTYSVEGKPNEGSSEVYVCPKGFAGTYRANIFCHSCSSEQPVQDFEVEANADGTITVWGDRWVETSPLYFVGADGKGRIGFAEDKAGRITARLGIARSDARYSTGWCVGPLRPMPIESWLNTQITGSDIIADSRIAWRM